MDVTWKEIGLESKREALNRYSLHLAHNRWDAEDLAQETWLRILGRGGEFERHGNPEAWMLRIAKNQWMDQVRRRKTFERVMSRYERHAAMDKSGNASEQYGLATIELLFGGLLKHLTPVQRTVFMLRDVYGFAARETAERLKMTEGAVKAALRRARQALAAVRREWADETLELPAEEKWKQILRSIALAYEAGDLAAVVELLARDVDEPAAAVGTAMVRSRYQAQAPTVNAQGRAGDAQAGFRASAA